MKLAIIGAMEAEILPILNACETYNCYEYANNKYYIAPYEGHELIIAYSKIGKVFASLTASIMIEHFKAEKVFFSGVAGAICPSMDIGDLVLATSTVQHDVDITAFGYKHGYISGSKIFIDTDKNLNDLAISVAKKNGINLKAGVIATGDQFINTEEKKTFIKTEFNALAAEMEGGSVNQVCNEFGVDCLVIRSISDNVNGDSVENFAEFVNIAANNSANFILSIIKEL